MQTVTNLVGTIHEFILFVTTNSNFKAFKEGKNVTIYVCTKLNIFCIL